MAPDLVLAVFGTSVLAVGVWRMEFRALYRPIAILLCAGGIVLITIAAARAGSNWSLRIAALGTYAGAGGLLGATTATLWAKRHAGAILVSLGMVATTGFKIVSAIAIPGGMLAVVMQALDARRPGSLFLLVGQALLFSTFGIQAVMIARGRWSLADQGIIGPNLFVSWRQVSAWDWKDSDTLAIALKPEFPRGRRFTIAVAPEAHESAAAILASKIPA
jgi:hypothetical protein